MKSYAWSLQYKKNGAMLKSKTSHPITTLLFKNRKEADDYRETLKFKDKIITTRVKINITPTTNSSTHYR